MEKRRPLYFLKMETFAHLKDSVGTECVALRNNAYTFSLPLAFVAITLHFYANLF